MILLTQKDWRHYWRVGGEEKALLEEIWFIKDMKASKQAPDHEVYSQIHKPPITQSLLKKYTGVAC